ncbi:MAG: hypothetical protein IPL17_09205 [Anaerolineales bacterium]|nr:hypothetical protein [Anaerolineales bacterium]
MAHPSRRLPPPVQAGLTVSFTYDGSATAPINIGSYAVTATVTDLNYTGTANGTLVILPATHSIPLTVGWNLVSFNVHPTNTDIATVLSSIDGNYDLVYAWDATSSSNNWLMYDDSRRYFGGNWPCSSNNQHQLIYQCRWLEPGGLPIRGKSSTA